jgi:hypothetical protein
MAFWRPDALEPLIETDVDAQRTGLDAVTSGCAADLSRELALSGGRTRL